MDLFIVVRWGSDLTPDGADGPDTHYLVRANDFREAVSLAEVKLRGASHSRVSASANVCLKLGQCSPSRHELHAAVVLGPSYQQLRGDDFAEGWLRHYADEDWKPLREGP